jgi:tetratricopeptide (TPR) repeat protein
LDAAIADYSRSIELAPNIAEYYAKRGLALLLQGKEAEAQRDFDQCLTLDRALKVSLERRIKEIKRQLATKRYPLLFPERASH